MIDPVQTSPGGLRAATGALRASPTQAQRTTNHDFLAALERSELEFSKHALKRIEQRAKALGLDSIFVLTTRTMHWFIRRGFQQVDPDWLPEARKRKYNWDRRSQVLVKKLNG